MASILLLDIFCHIHICDYSGCDKCSWVRLCCILAYARADGSGFHKQLYTQHCLKLCLIVCFCLEAISGCTEQVRRRQNHTCKWHRESGHLSKIKELTFWNALSVIRSMHKTASERCLSCAAVNILLAVLHMVFPDGRCFPRQLAFSYASWFPWTCIAIVDWPTFPLLYNTIRS